MDFKKLKPMLNDFIKYYYEDLDNASGGHLHIALDDGNLEPDDLFSCQEFAQEEGDTFGYFLATLMREFETDELEEMYEKDHWGMRK